MSKHFFNLDFTVGRLDDQPRMSPHSCCSTYAWDPGWLPLHGHHPLCDRVRATDQDFLRAMNDGRVWLGLPSIGTQAIELRLSGLEWDIVNGKMFPPFFDTGLALPDFIARLRLAQDDFEWWIGSDAIPPGIKRSQLQPLAKPLTATVQPMSNLFQPTDLPDYGPGITYR